MNIAQIISESYEDDELRTMFLNTVSDLYVSPARVLCAQSMDLE